MLLLLICHVMQVCYRFEKSVGILDASNVAVSVFVFIRTMRVAKTARCILFYLFIYLFIYLLLHEYLIKSWTLEI